MAAAVSAVALSASFVGANYLIDVTQTHGAVVQGGQRLVADAAASAPGPGLAPAALPAIASQPGISTAVGLTPTTVFVPYPGNADNLAEAVTPGPLGAVLNLKVISGTLDRFGPGDIALSKTITGTNAVTAKVGDTITTYLADGTPTGPRSPRSTPSHSASPTSSSRPARPAAATSDRPRSAKFSSAARPASHR